MSICLSAVTDDRVGAVEEPAELVGRGILPIPGNDRQSPLFGRALEDQPGARGAEDLGVGCELRLAGPTETAHGNMVVHVPLNAVGVGELSSGH